MLILGYGSSGGGISSACTLQSGCRNSLAFPRVNTTWRPVAAANSSDARAAVRRSEEHTSELQSLMRISYAVFCLKKKIQLSVRTTPIKTKISNKQSNTYSKQTDTNNQI